jgi:hypothetical protein
VSEKTELIKKTLKEIQEHRKTIQYTVFRLKQDALPCSKEQRYFLFFKEKKCFRNTTITTPNYAPKVVHAKGKNRVKSQNITVLSNYTQQSVSDKKTIQALTALKRSFALTRIYPHCGIKQKLTFTDRPYIWACEYSKKRNIQATQGILSEETRMHLKQTMPLMRHLSAVETKPLSCGSLLSSLRLVIEEELFRRDHILYTRSPLC